MFEKSLETLTTYDWPRARYQLSFAQEPDRGRVCSGKDKKGGILDPLPIVKLRVEDGDPTCKYIYSPHMFMLTTLIRVDKDDPHKHEERADLMHGNRSATNTKLRDANNQVQDASYFLYPDLCILEPGEYKLQFTLFENRMVTFPDSTSQTAAVFLESLESRAFRVYTPKDFPGIRPSSALTRQFHEQGHKTMKVRNEPRKIKRRLPNFPLSGSSSLAGPFLGGTELGEHPLMHAPHGSFSSSSYPSYSPQEFEARDRSDREDPGYIGYARHQRPRLSYEAGTYFREPMYGSQQQQQQQPQQGNGNHTTSYRPHSFLPASDSRSNSDSSTQYERLRNMAISDNYSHDADRGTYQPTRDARFARSSTSSATSQERTNHASMWQQNAEVRDFSLSTLNVRVQEARPSETTPRNMPSVSRLTSGLPRTLEPAVNTLPAISPGLDLNNHRMAGGHLNDSPIYPQPPQIQGRPNIGQELSDPLRALQSNPRPNGLPLLSRSRDEELDYSARHRLF